MRDNRVNEVWVGADNAGAVEFYGACGFAPSDAANFQPVYMTKALDSGTSAVHS